MVFINMALIYILIGILFVVWLLLFQTREGEMRKSVNDLGLWRLLTTLGIVVLAWPLFVVLSIGNALENGSGQ